MVGQPRNTILSDNPEPAPPSLAARRTINQTNLDDTFAVEMAAHNALSGRTAVRDLPNALQVLGKFVLGSLRPLTKMEPTIQLASGLYFDFAEPDKTPLMIGDIAHALSKVCRFAGHIMDDGAVYTVAQHSVLASVYVEPGFELEALLHDATESVLGDVSSPLKQLLPEYKRLEDRVHRSIARTYGLPLKMSPEVKLVDLRLLTTEKRDLMAGHLGEPEWRDLPDPFQFHIRPWTPKEAKDRFLARWAELTDQDGPHAS